MRYRSAWAALSYPSMKRPSRRRNRPPSLGQFTDPDLVLPPGEDVVIVGEDEFIDLNTPGTGEREDEELPITGTPGAVPVRAGNWDLEAKPFATYKIASGDTFFGLAITYLGAGGRALEIWNTGNNRQKFPDPNVIDSTGPLDMPEEARDRMNAFLKLGKTTGTPGQIPPGEVRKVKEAPTRIAVAVVAGVALLVTGVVIYKVAT